LNKAALSIIIISFVAFTSLISSSHTTQDMPLEKTSNTSAPITQDSPWPMFGHDVRHTGRSSYSTFSNHGGIQWMLQVPGGIDTSPAIGPDGTLYVAGCEYYGPLYAIYPNGTIKWQYNTSFRIDSDPAIAENGTIYFGCWDDYFYAVNPNGTLKWKFAAVETIVSSPAIGNDGTVYFGVLGPGLHQGRVHALNPNGTEKWHYDTGEWVYNHPAIGSDDTIYISSNDKYLYALYPNGTLKWRFTAGDIFGSPTIGDDETIYIPCHNKYLYALYPNGTEKWRGYIERWSGFTPSIASDGTIYVGGRDLYAFYPNGTRKWVYSAGHFYHVTTPTQAISADGTIYAGFSNETGAGGYLIAVNPNGTEQWREWIHDERVYSSPTIAEEGTVYVGTTWSPILDYGYLYAFNGERFEDLSIQKPISGKLYISDEEKCSTLRGRTVCIGPITIEAMHPNPANVTKVEFYLDGKKQTEILTLPYQWTYNRFSIKEHTITVVATNVIGVTRSDSITLWKFF
jgi:outer membrane protein assembly factor BamB